MGLIHWISSLLFVSSIAQASVLPWKDQQYHAKRNTAVATDASAVVEVVISDFTTLTELAEELSVDFICLLAANPLLSLLAPGEKCVVPYSCCKTSCKGSFCSKRPQCQGQSTSSAPAQSSGTTTTTVSVITTSIASTLSATGSSSLGSPSSSSVSSTTALSSTGSTSTTASLTSSSTVSISPSSSSATGSSTGGSSIPPGISSASGSTAVISSASSSTAVISSTSSSSTGDIPPPSSSTAEVSSASSSAGNVPPTSSSTTGDTTGGSSSTSSVSSISSGTTTPIVSGIITTTNSLGQTVTSQSPSTSPISTGSASTIVSISSGSTVTSQNSATSPSPIPSTTSSVITTTNSLGQTIISDSSSVVTVSTGSSSASISTLPDGSTVPVQTSTALPSSISSTISALVTTTNSLGQTVISDSSGAVTLPTGISSASIVTLPDGTTVTFQPSTTSLSSTLSTNPTLVTTTNSLGQTVVSDSSGAVTLPTGISSSSLVTLPDGSVITFQPTTASVTSVPGPVTTTDSLGETVISDSSGAVTIPTGLSSSTLITLPDGTVVTFQPTAQASSSSSSSIIPGLFTTTDASGETIISDSSGAATLPTGLSTSSVITLPDGSIVTFTPTSQAGTSTSSSAAVGIITTTDAAGETVVSSSGEGFTIPTGLTTPVTITNGDGVPFTFTPTTTSSSTTSSSSVIPIGGIFPVTTSVPAPKATDGGTEIPCNLWFFNLCIQWGEINIGGWEFNLPQGIRPPGPPPPITFPPSLHITVSISGTLPPWPSLTIGSDNLPTYEPKPTDGPDNECKTESAEVCLTSTSFGVDTATVTTTSTVLATCATVYGCEVSDSSTSTTTTSTSSTSTYPYSCTPGCSACVAKRALPTPTVGPSVLAMSAMKPRDLLAEPRVLTLAERDIPDSNSADGIAELYDDVIGSADSTKVPLDNQGQVGLSSSRFKYFDNSELNIYVTGLEGCTSIVVVSQLGAYVTHFWEPSFTEPGGPPNFQNDVLNYFTNGRPGDAGEGGNTEPLSALVQGGVFPSAQYNTHIFIMTPATYDDDLTADTPRNEQTASLTDGDFTPLFDGTTPQVPVDRLGPIRTALGNLMPGVPIAQFTYRRQTNAVSSAFGKAMILYSNKQVIDPDDPAEDLAAPQKAVWQCWMQGKKMGQDIWDALPGQITSCNSNQKRQAGDLCSLSSVAPSSTQSLTSSTDIASSVVPSSTLSPTTTTANTISTTASSSVVPISTSTTASSSVLPTSTSSTPTTSSLTPTPTPSPVSLSDLPTLSSTVQTTPSGETCVSIATQTQCALGPNPSETACVSSTYCASFAPTSTSTTPSATPTAYVTVEIYSDSGCSKQVEQINLLLGQCYEPTNSFKCFYIGYVSPAAQSSAEIEAFKGEGCFAQDSSTEVHTYTDLGNLQNTDQHPFTMGSLVLYPAGT